MIVILPSSYARNEKLRDLFYFNQQSRAMILPTDIKNLENIEFKCVRKIVRNVYRQKFFRSEGKLLWRVT
jgi:hypothetical protein